MFVEVQTALQRLLHDAGQIPAADVDVRFDAPTRAFVNSVTRPTLDLFLYEVEENVELRQTGMQTTRANGRGIHRMPPRRFELRYMVSALTTDVADEHLLLWRALLTLMKHPTLPDELAPEAARALGVPVTTKVLRREESARPLDIWSALETPPRAALMYAVTVPVDLDLAIESPLVLTRTARVHRTFDADEQAAPETRTAIGGVVRDRKGRPLAGAAVTLDGRALAGAVTNDAGEFTLSGVPSGRVTLRVASPDRSPKLVKVVIPSESYEIVVD